MGRVLDRLGVVFWSSFGVVFSASAGLNFMGVGVVARVCAEWVR